MMYHVGYGLDIMLFQSQRTIPCLVLGPLMLPDRDPLGCDGSTPTEKEGEDPEAS